MPWNPVHPIKNGIKKCITCHQEFTLKMFPKQIKCKDGIRPDCKECNRKKNKIYYEKNKQKVLERAREYGKTEYRKKYCRDLAKIKLKKKREEQATRPRTIICECCFENPKDIKGIVWDHCHITGKFRGWLCNRCNRILGMCKDNKEVFKKMIKYLEAYATS